MTIEHGKKVLKIEAEAITELMKRIDQNFVRAVELLYACGGKVVVTGMGKSGIIGQKIAATLASTGTPSFFLHPAEGLHGDLGMLSPGDVVLAISYSGETQEVAQLLPAIKRSGIPLICFTGRVRGTIPQNSDVVIDISVAEEASRLDFLPTASTTATLAMGDALAVALLEKRGFQEADFAMFHPGGVLGKRLLIRVEDVMHHGAGVPVVYEETGMAEVILEMSGKRLGVTAVIDHEHSLRGIITDGDLRRLLETRKAGIFSARAGEVMTKNPKVISKDALAAHAVQLMEKHAITALVVVDDRGRVEGIVHLHDLLKRGIV